MYNILRKNSFIFLFIVTNVFFVFLIIYKKSLFSHLNYEKQRLETQLQELQKEKQKIEQDFLMTKNPKLVQKYVSSNLGMQKIKINQIKRLAPEISAGQKL